MPETTSLGMSFPSRHSSAVTVPVWDLNCQCPYNLDQYFEGEHYWPSAWRYVAPLSAPKPEVPATGLINNATGKLDRDRRLRFAMIARFAPNLLFSKGWALKRWRPEQTRPTTTVTWRRDRQYISPTTVISCPMPPNNYIWVEPIAVYVSVPKEKGKCCLQTRFLVLQCLPFSSGTGRNLKSCLRSEISENLPSIRVFFRVVLVIVVFIIQIKVYWDCRCRITHVWVALFLKTASSESSLALAGHWVSICALAL